MSQNSILSSVAAEFSGKHDRSWAVVKTHSTKEQLASTQLARQGFECYCPKIAKRIRHARRTMTVLKPLFPSYLFVQLPPHKHIWRPILSTIGVQSLVQFGDTLGLLDHGFIESLRSREEDGVIIRSVPIQTPPRSYKIGDKVVLNGGPFDGAISTILSVNENNRLVVLMNLLQHGVRAQVKADQVVPVL